MGAFYRQPKEDADPTRSFGAFVETALEKGGFDAVYAPVEVPQGPAVMQALITNAGKAGRINPLAPVMTANAASLLGRLTIGDTDKKLAAFCRPCEVRALVELVKLQQAKLENITLIGMDCHGTVKVPALSTTASGNGGFAKTSIETFTALRGGRELPGGMELRTACRSCPYPEAENVDLRLCLFGDRGSDFVFEAVTEKGKTAIEAMGLESAREPVERRSRLEAARATRQKAREETLGSLRGKVETLEGMLEVFATCLRCYNCRNACPICYCPVCTFATPTFEYEGSQYFKWAATKGAIRLPADTTLFHLTRANHMAPSCIGCGMCTQYCPCDIPVGEVFQCLQERVGAIFDYVPGRRLDEELPIQTYQEEELSPR